MQLEGLPEVTCKAFDELYEKVDPQSVTLVFADAHINSPASMFGHTFLRIDSSYDSKLLSHAINYAANADQSKENGVVFAIKGLFGGYPGIYSLLPYYEKLKEYKNTEQRDIWEYELNLTPDEVSWMLMHIWEVHATYSWYYFFDENCSYHMLWLLEVARPSVHLREHFYYQVIPPETVMAISDENLIRTRRYRPSKRSLLLAYEASLNFREREMAKDVATGVVNAAQVAQEPTLSLRTKQLVLEAAAELCEYYLIENTLDKKRYLPRFQAILSERSRLGHKEPLHVSTPANPEIAHYSSRARYQFGVVEGYGINYLGIRASYHDLRDSDIGMLAGTQIEFFDLLLFYESASFYDSNNEHLDLSYDKAYGIEYLTLLSLGSYAPQSSFFQPLSWRMRLGWDRDYKATLPLFNAMIGAGMTWGNADAFVYAMGEALGYYDDKDSVGALAPLVGVSLKEAKAFKTTAEYRYRLYHNGWRQHLVDVNQLYSLSSSLAIKLSYGYKTRANGDENSFKASFEYYF